MNEADQQAQAIQDRLREALIDQVAFPEPSGVEDPHCVACGLPAPDEGFCILCEFHLCFVCEPRDVPSIVAHVREHGYVPDPTHERHLEWHRAVIAEHQAAFLADADARGVALDEAALQTGRTVLVVDRLFTWMSNTVVMTEGLTDSARIPIGPLLQEAETYLDAQSGTAEGVKALFGVAIQQGLFTAVRGGPEIIVLTPDKGQDPPMMRVWVGPALLQIEEVLVVERT